MPQGQVQPVRSLEALRTLAQPAPTPIDAMTNRPKVQDLPGMVDHSRDQDRVEADTLERESVLALQRQAEQAANPEFEDARLTSRAKIGRESTLALEHGRNLEDLSQVGPMAEAKGHAQSDVYWQPGQQSMRADEQQRALDRIGAQVNPAAEQRGQAAQFAHEDKMAALKNALEIATQKRGSAEGIAAMEVVQRLIAGEQSSHVAPANTQYGGAMGAALAPHAPVTQPPAAGGGTTRMRAPDGTEGDVPNDQVAHFTAQGATIIR